LYLSRLQAYGFKSFAQKLELGFQNGITCVVGPNGCGKSNVVDALRWALGEQRPRSLRSSSMEDVIFAGSRSRKPLGMAEVSVVIDNSKKILPVDFSEITVTRRLFRSGESDYLLNKIPCRLMDIQNLFMDTGLGPNAYSVIEQGMVDEIISDKTEERRRLFEEAAGVTRYKVRRKSAWNKLLSIQQDLQRIDDIIGEVERQVAYLGRQERKARLYRTVSDQLADLSIRLARFTFFQRADRVQPIMEEMSFLKDDVEVLAIEIARHEASLEETRTELMEQDQILSEANAEVSRHTELVHRKDREILVAREESRNLIAFLDRSGHQEAELTERLDRNRKGQEETGDQLAGLVAGLAEKETTLAESTEALQELTADLESRRKGSGDQKRRLIDLMRETSELRTKVERSRAEVEGLAERRERFEDDTAKVLERRQEALAEAEAADSTIVQVRGELDDVMETRKTASEQRRLLQEKQEEVQTTHRNLASRVEADSARKALLEKLREGFEGYSQGVRALAVDSPFTNRIRGVVADLIEVDAKYTAAIEAALGRALECLMVGTTSDAMEAIAFLRSGDHPAAALLPMERISYGTGTPWTPPIGDGIIGRGSDLVKSRGEGDAIRALLRRTLVVRDAETALVLMGKMKSQGVSVVTLQGDLFAADGTIYGGSGAAAQTGLIGRAQLIEGLEKDIADGQAQLIEVEAELETLRSDLRTVVETLEQMDELLQGLRNRLAGLERDRQNARSEAGRQAVTLESLEADRNRLQERRQELDRSILESAASLEERSAEHDALEAEAKTADDAIAEREARRTTQQETVSGLRVEVTSLKGRVESLQREGERLAREETTLTGEIDRLQKERDQSTARKEELEQRVETAAAEMEELNRAQTELVAKRDSQSARQQELLNTSRQVEDELKAKNRKVSTGRERLHELELELRELKTRAEELRERIRHDYEVDIEELGRLNDPEFNADISQKKTVEMQERLRKMGSVNMAALEEYEVQRERYEFLTNQRTDLMDAEETLKRTISRIDRTARSRFLETFALIRENFQTTFAEFFEGGEADVTIDQDEDPLEASISISAKPRGKRLQNINLLSGGERALTAISLLFAIYLVKPSPFCILDEVDAPLDDANVGRFVRVIRKFSGGTQFIVVTHNKRTMEAADTLHGVTMEEPGVSKLVTVEVAQVQPGERSGQVEAVAEEVAV